MFDNFPKRITHRDESSPFTIDATLGGWRMVEGEPGLVQITIASGTLLDADKGEFSLAGVVITIRLHLGGVDPKAVVNPGDLSEFQQAGLLDAVSTAVRDRNDAVKNHTGRQT